MSKPMIALTLCLLAQAPQAQEAGRDDGPTVVSLNDLKLVHYRPEFTSARILGEFLSGTLDRRLYVQERGGLTGSPIPSVSQLGDSLVLYDTVEHVERILTALESLDVSSSGPESDLVTLRYDLRYLSTRDAQMALIPFRAQDVVTVEARRQLILRDTPARVAEMEALLESLDVPEPLFRLQVQLIVGRETQGSGTPVSGELARELGALMPQFRFEQLAAGLLQSAANPNQRVSMHFEGGGDTFELRFHPQAYDASSGSLTVGDCELQREDGMSGNVARLFSTHTIFRGGEATVLGGAGTEPIFVVVRVTPAP